MSNNYYTPTGSPATSSAATSSTIRNEFNIIEDGFDKLPGMPGNSNLPVSVNEGETALEAISIESFLDRLGLSENLGTFAVPASTTISAFMKTLLDDADAATARATLGLAIGSAVQAYDAFLASIAALGTGADKMVYLTGVNTAAETTLTAFARTILDDADAATVIATLGVDADITTLSLPANTTISAFIKTVLDDADAATTRATIGAISSLADDISPQLGGELDCQAHSVGFTLQSATGDGATTIDWKLGNKFKFTFGAQNDTLTFTAPTNPCNILLMMVQDGVGSRTATWPVAVKWPAGVEPTLSAGGNDIDIVSFFYDGSNYYGVEALDFS